MSKNLPGKEEAINQLYETIKFKFNQDGVLNEMRCMLQMKMLAMMNGKGDDGTLLEHSKNTNMNAGDPRMEIMHQLIMEYLHWHGFQYTAEMFASETGTENKTPMRQSLEGLLGKFQHQELPILLEIVVNMFEKQTQRNEDTEDE